jgi:hypothetical protein
MKNLEKKDVEFTTNLIEKTKEFIGKKVTAYVGAKTRRSFETAISISGILEEKSQNGGVFRIVDINDDGTYTYFKQADILRIVAHPTHVFNNGAVAIIQISVINS